MLNSTFPRALLPITAVYKSLRKFVPAVAVFVVLFPLSAASSGPACSCSRCSSRSRS